MAGRVAARSPLYQEWEDPNRGVRVWWCGVCGRHAQWGPGWAIRGSIRDEEDGRPVLIVCSEECLNRASEGAERPLGDSYYHTLEPRKGGGELIEVAPSRFYRHARRFPTSGSKGSDNL